jgi:hypothetical protein
LNRGENEKKEDTGKNPSSSGFGLYLLSNIPPKMDLKILANIYCPEPIYGSKAVQ